jgi:hypothetical protein
MPIPRKWILHICIFTPLMALILAGCNTTTDKPTPTPTEISSQVETIVPTNTPAMDELQVETAPDQALALLPGAQADLDMLSGLTQYQLDLVLHDDGHSFTGHSLVNFTNTEDVPLDSLYFRLLPNGQASYGDGSLTVTEVSRDGVPVEAELSASDTVLEIPLPEPLAVGEQIQLEFDFQGVVPQDFGGDESTSGYGIYNYSDGVLSLSGWYPILAVYDEDGWNLDPVSAIGDSVYSDIALYTVDVVADPDLILASTGVSIDQEPSDGKTRHRIMSGPVRDFFLVMSPDFETESRDIEGTVVNSYYLPEHMKGGKAALSITADSLQVFNERFGTYPYAEMDVVEVPMRYALGVEYPGIFLVSSELYEDPEDPSFAVTTAHEVAHQWWYGVVGNDVFEEPWLDEALTTYASSLYYQDVVGPGAYQGLVGYWTERYDRLVQDGGDEPITESLSYFEESPNRGSYGGVVYTKGALFFKTLRDELGDDAFFEALQSYYQENKYQIAQGDDLLRSFEEASGGSLEDLYQEWLK